MNHAKKMVLIDENALKRLQRRQNVSTPPLTSRLNGLDHEIQHVLKETNISDDEKVRLYTQALQNYLQLYNQKKNQPINVKLQPQVPTVTEVSETPQEAQPIQQEETAPQNDLERNILQTLPKTSKHRGKMILEKIKENPEVMKWDDKGQLVFHGKPIAGSHISDLIVDSLKTGKTSARGPLGWEMFTQGLAKVNAPEHWLRNVQRKSALREFKAGTQKSSQREEEEAGEDRNDWFPTPMTPPGPMRSKKTLNKSKAMRQRWLTFRN